MSLKTHIICIFALCAILSSTALILFVGIAAACSGTGGGGTCPAPSVSTGGADSITSNSATLTGSVNPRGCHTTYVFEYGRSSEGYPNEIGSSAGSGTSSVSVQTYSSLGLLPSTSYHYRLTAWNSGGETTGGSGSFTTPAACSKPTVTTHAATSITDVSAVLTGTVNPNGCQTTYWFEWGPSSSPSTYPNSFAISAVTASTTLTIEEKLSGLQPGTGYHYRLVAENNGGRTDGLDKPFTTALAPQYLALGDSYSSGTGTGSNWTEPTSVAASCHRTKQSYPYLLASAHPGWTFINATCHGAVTSDVLNSQIPSQVSPNIKWVTYSIGGNDAKFRDVIEACVLKDEISCLIEVNNAERIMTSELPHRLNTVNSAIKTKAPNAKVIVFDYPRLFMEQSCSIFSTLTVSEQKALNGASETLRREISAATARAGSNFVFKDVIPGFEPHQICEGGSGSSTEWINGLSYPIEESYHPKSAGHSNVYLPLALAVTG